MSTTEPKAGEWWWVEIADGGRRRPAEVVIEPRTGHLCWEMEGRLVNARPIARIPDPPAPEPTEAEKIDARRADAFYKAWCNAGSTDYETRCRLFAEAIRASDEAAGYVTVPVDLLKDCADDLEAWVRFAYPEDSRKYPSEARRYVRDMLPVARLRAAIAAHEQEER